MNKKLKEKLQTKEATIGIVGLGYVGLPTAFEKAKNGYDVIGFDVSNEKIVMINHGRNYISDVDDFEFEQLVQAKKIRATMEFAELKDVDVVFICVPTPITKDKQPDLRFVETATEQIAKYIKKGTLVILESTTYPGTTEEIMVPKIQEKGFIVGKDVFVAYSPERIDPGNQTYTLENTPKVVGGVTEACTEVASLAVGKNAFPVSSTKIAEMAKVFENTFRFINIGLVNETAMLCEKMGIDTREMIEASGTKPYGFMAFQPGPGIGGHCIPVDPFYLTWKAEKMGEKTKMIDLAGKINDGMSRYVVDQSMKYLNKHKKALNGSKVAILGVAYKKDINDLRESPVLPIIKEMIDEGAQVLLCDPHVSQVKIGQTVLPIHSDEKDKIKEADLVLLTTDHSAFDYDYIAKHASIIFDTRNGFKGVKDIKADYYKL